MIAAEHPVARPLWPLASPGLAALVLLTALLLAYPLEMTPELPGASRYLVLPLLIAAGLACAHRLGLRLTAATWRDNAGLPLLVSIAVGLGILAFDRESLGGAGSASLLYYAPKAAAEEMIYRLCLMSCIALAVAAVAGKRLPPAASIMFAAALAQAINIALNMPDGASLAYVSLRYWLPGMVWGWLYWRCGFLAALVGHVGTHLWLDPMLAYLS